MSKNSSETSIIRYKPSILDIYGFIGVIKLFFSFLVTKLIISNAKLIRLPVELRGKKYIDFGENLSLGKGCKIEAYPYINKAKIIKFGKNVGINDYLHLTGIESITIEDNVMMAGKVYISDSNHGSYSGDIQDSMPETKVRTRPLSSKPILIEENVWIGEAAAILPGVTIGRNSIIGAHSVVTKDIPPNSIAVGNPARVIKKFDNESNHWTKSIKI